MPATVWWLAVLSSTVITAAQQNRRKFPTSDAVVTLQLLRGDAANGGRARREVSADSEDGLGIFASSFSPRGKVEGSKTPSFDDLGPALEAASNGETVFGFEAGGVQYRMKRLARYLDPRPPLPHTLHFHTHLATFRVSDLARVRSAATPARIHVCTPTAANDCGQVLGVRL